MKVFCMVLFLFLSGCATYNPVPAEEKVITKEAELPGMTKDQIFARSKVWIERHFYSRGDIIENAERNTGVIIANGFIDYPASGKFEEAQRIQQTISFRMSEQASDGWIRLSFYDLMLDIPKYYYPWRSWPLQEYYGGYSEPVEEEGDFAAARRGLLGLADRLVDDLKQKQVQ